LQECQSLLAWYYSFSQDTTYEGGGCLWRSSQDAGTGAASKEKQSSIQNLSSLEENIGYHSTKEKLIVFIGDSKNGNE
jgi:hypothetical protein